MRRNMGRRGGNNSGSGGPLMTGHLKDIDMELELLKRKREMIEQQQQLLVMEQQFKSSRHYDSSYDQTRFEEPEQHGSNRDFTHLYDNGSKHRNQFGRKRQADFQWQYEGSPKRTTPRRKSNQSQFNQHGPGNTGPANIRNQRPGPKSSPRRPAPLMDVKIKPSIGQKMANQKASQKEFTPTKMFKPKASVTPNKLSQSSTERKSLGSAANDPAGDVSRMLLPDQVPTQQVSGRLELALGAIMKNIRRLVPDDSVNSPLLRSIHLQRVMKQAIRERIRTVMLGKVVGSLNEILAIYREEFPEETDMDIVNLALEAGGVQVQQSKPKTKPKPKESGDPMEYFRRNMIQLLDTTLQEMFNKLEEIYAKNQQSDNETPENQGDQPAEEKNEQHDDEFIKFMENSVKARDVKRFLPRLMRKYIPYMIKCLNIDAMFQNAKAAITMKANLMAASNIEGQDKAETTVAASTTPSDARQARNLPHFVKIMGRPSLPRKNSMQAFLNQFNPKSIKKHRSIHNLLFVGFSEKTDFDLIVAADGTVIGRSTLSIRVCSGRARDSTGENNENFTTDVGQEGDKKNDSKDSEIITAELDGQITDLLSSIRKSEEESNETAEETGNETKSSENMTETASEQDDNVQRNDKEIENVEKPDNEVSTADTDENKDTIKNLNLKEEIMDVVDEAEKKDVELDNEPEKKDVKNELDNEAESQNSEDVTMTDNLQESATTDTNSQVTSNGDTHKDSEMPTETSDNGTNLEEKSEDDKVGDLKSNSSGRSTPSRMSARLANVTPSTIRTRRASRLAQN